MVAVSPSSRPPRQADAPDKLLPDVGIRCCLAERAYAGDFVKVLILYP